MRRIEWRFGVDAPRRRRNRIAIADGVVATPGDRVPPPIDLLRAGQREHVGSRVGGLRALRSIVAVAAIVDIAEYIEASDIVFAVGRQRSSSVGVASGAHQIANHADHWRRAGRIVVKVDMQTKKSPIIDYICDKLQRCIDVTLKSTTMSKSASDKNVKTNKKKKRRNVN
jgi:hypothetical protein